jgi:hypothetical protein
MKNVTLILSLIIMLLLTVKIKVDNNRSMATQKKSYDSLNVYKTTIIDSCHRVIYEKNFINLMLRSQITEVKEKELRSNNRYMELATKYN